MLQRSRTWPTDSAGRGNTERRERKGRNKWQRVAVLGGGGQGGAAAIWRLHFISCRGRAGTGSRRAAGLLHSCHECESTGACQYAGYIGCATCRRERLAAHPATHRLQACKTRLLSASTRSSSWAGWRRGVTGYTSGGLAAAPDWLLTRCVCAQPNRLAHCSLVRVPSCFGLAQPHFGHVMSCD